MNETMRTNQFTLEMRTPNGFGITCQPGTWLKIGPDTICTFVVRNPDRQATLCKVVLPDFMKGCAAEFTNLDHLPFGDRLWESFCEEALVNYLARHAAVPSDAQIRVTDLTEDLRRWISQVVTTCTCE